MLVEIKIPSPGESITQVELARWLVSDGEQVARNQEIAEIESDKATLPLIAPEQGILKILIEAGSQVNVGSLAATIDITVLNSKPISGDDIKPQVTSNTEANRITQKTAVSSSEVKITPLARRLMDENKIDLYDVLEGLQKITRSDVERVIQLRKGTSIENIGVSRESERIKMSTLRKKLSSRLVAVKNQTAMLTTFNETDMSLILAIRKKYQEDFIARYQVKLGLMSFFTMAVTKALREFPVVNSQIDGDEIIQPGFCDIAIAMQSKKGLLVPVLRNTEALSLAEIEQQIAELATKARDNTISIAEMSGGTFTITNGGVFGSLLSTPLINPPQSAILGMHNIVERPVAINGKVEIRPMMYLALSYDHRLIDGKDSVGFLVKVKELVENPERLVFNGKPADESLLGL
jgi:2-oxoglutarate dehydrogenase E2 component (dihydrolipoamide succinyltransferase)